MKYGLQMYSVRDAAEKDLLGTLEKVAALGYHYAEFAGFFGHSAEAVRAKLLECGMEVSSTHTGMQELSDDVIGETIRYHKTLGNRLIVLPWADLDDQQKLDDFVTQTEKVQARLAFGWAITITLTSLSPTPTAPAFGSSWKNAPGWTWRSTPTGPSWAGAIRWK